MDGGTFGRYQLIELLGRGGMGEVWRSYDTEFKRTVAIKILLQQFTHDDTFCRRFRREAEIAASLNDPHVVPIHSFGEIQGRLYVDMRLIQGEDLGSLIAAGPLAATRAVLIVEQVASALTEAHEAGLVHRDVKPANILLGADDFAYLIDFGIAHEADGTRVTKVGDAVGTWAYMAPERFASRQLDPRSDVYALACVLYECLTGRRPFGGTSLESQFAGHSLTPPPRPSEAIASLPPELDAVIANGMAKDPARRYQTARYLAQAARRALAYGSVQHPVARNTPASQYFSSTPPPAAAPPPRNRRTTIAVVGALVAVVALVCAGVVFVAGRDDDASTSAASVTSSSPSSLSATQATGGTTATTSTKPQAMDLDALLLEPADVDSLVGSTGLAITLSERAPTESGDQFTPPQCQPLLVHMGAYEYGSSGFSAMRWHQLSNDSMTFVSQGITEFPSDTEALAFIDDNKSSWLSCRDKVVSDYDPALGFTTDWTVGEVRSSGQLMTVQVSLVNSLSTSNPNYACQRLARATSRVVIDVYVCDHEVTDQATMIANAIAEHVPR